MRSSLVTSAETETTLKWTCHPLKRNKLRSIGVCVLLSIIATLVYYGTNSLGFTILGVVILFASLAKFFFPTGYTLDEKGVTIKTMTQTLTKEWSIYRTFYVDKNGVLLSPFAAPSRLENFRGLYVMFEGNRDAVVKFIEAHIRPAESASGDPQ